LEHERVLEAVGYSLVVADYHDRLLTLDGANCRLRDRGWRHWTDDPWEDAT
jgi:hypothetical protein